MNLLIEQKPTVCKLSSVYGSSSYIIEILLGQHFLWVFVPNLNDTQNLCQEYLDLQCITKKNLHINFLCEIVIQNLSLSCDGL